MAVLRRMSDSIVTRGPDSDGHWLDSDTQIALGHRRLAIVDLSPAGHQPMASPSQRHVIAFNGEVYNHLNLRSLLEQAGTAPTWRGHSDTETILACIDAWGIERTIDACTGMFAMAIWDRETYQLTLVRDRLGEKPLYYGWQGCGQAATFMFASELKALKVHPSFKGTVDRGALSLMMRHNYVPAPYSIYQDIKKLEPGTILTVSLRQPEPRTQTYWSASQAIADGRARPFTGSPESAVDELESLLKAAIGRQMMADVPLGAFLSGGIDSSTIVALMQTQSSRPVKTFTIGFNEEGYNEAVHAKAVAKHLGTEHTELYVPAEKALEVVPKLPSLYCEPFSDSSQIPTYLVAELARKHVTVALSGDAGDELFCGYNRYTMTQRLWGRLSKYPKPLRQLASNAVRSLSPNTWNKLLGPVRSILPTSIASSNIGDRLHKGAGVLSHETSEQLYRSLVSHWGNPSELVRNGIELPTKLTTWDPGVAGAVERMMAIDTVTYLPDDILAKVDRAAMGVSLETRVPMLDHQVVEFAWRLPLDYKLREAKSKWVLRQLLYRHVPKTLVERPKMGFGVPLDNWLRTSLKDWAEALLDEGRLRHEGFFDPAPIRKKWQEHLAGSRNWQYQLWDVLMFQAWLEHERA